jgi:hypothetical protein
MLGVANGWMEAVVTYLWILFRHFPEKTEGNYETSQAE